MRRDGLWVRLSAVLGIGLVVALAAGGCASSAAPVPEPRAVVDGETVEIGPYAVVDGELAEVPDIEMGERRTVRRILAEGMHRNRIMDHLEHLTREIGPRLTASSRLEEANRWTAARFESWGLENVRLEPWGQASLRFDRGECSGTVYMRSGEGEDAEYNEIGQLEFTTLAWTRGTDGPVRAPVVRMPRTVEQLEEVEGRLGGSWVLIPTEYGGRRGIRGVGRMLRLRTRQREAMRDRLEAGEILGEAGGEEGPAYPDDGVSGVWRGELRGEAIPNGRTRFEIEMVVGEDGAVTGEARVPGFYVAPIENGRLDRESMTVTLDWESPMGPAPMRLVIQSGEIDVTGEFGGEPLEVDLSLQEQQEGPSEEELILARVLARDPVGFISSSRDARVWTTSAPGWRELSSETVARDIEVLVSEPGYDMINSRLADGAPIEVAFELDHRLADGPIELYNTIAEIRGSDPALRDEVVIVSAHLDSWDGPGSQGATDNGTGSSVVLESARILAAAGARPKRTIRFILWTGEEQGLLGSRAYVEAHAEEMDRISAVFVDDGGTNYQGGLHAIEPMRDMLAAATAPVNGRFYDEVEQEWMNVNVRVRERMPRGGGSDHAAFNAVGVPGFFWAEVGRANYGYGWHTQNDRFELAIAEYLHQSATCTAVTAYNLASAPEMLSRKSGEGEPEAEAAAN